MGPRPAPGRPHCAKREAGFTLIEVVVAFLLLSIVLAAGFEIFSTGMARASDLADRSQALAIAQSKLAAAGTEELLRDGQARGESEDRRFRWSMSVLATEEGQDPRMPVQSPYLLYRVDVRVEWHGSRGRDQDIELATLALGQRP
jgi:general secretion pathway protein I